jgi:hypothetical protein
MVFTARLPFLAHESGGTWRQEVAFIMEAGARSEADQAFLLDDGVEAPPIVRFDERRMHIRAYDYWVSLLRDRALPSIEDLNPSEIQDFGSHSVLLDFTAGIADPHIAFLGTALAAQCDVTGPIERASQIPPRTLLSQLVDHYPQIIANAAPISLEAEFINQRDSELLYRGIMMPFSADGDTIDFVYGVINWKEVVSEAIAEGIAAEVAASPPARATPGDAELVWADLPAAFSFPDEDDEEENGNGRPLELTAEMMTAPGAATGLGDSLALAQEAAAVAQASEGRTRAALYRAIGLAHAFVCVAASRPDDYAALLAGAGIEVQSRSPLTALVKLVFGASYDKTRLAEFASAIGYALDQNMAPGALTNYLMTVPGGLKGVVASARAARRGTSATREPAHARHKLAHAHALDADALHVDETGLAVVIVRRESDGMLSLVASLSDEDRLAQRVYAAAARQL